eukprot:NODE_176_length_2421_cov_92.346556_g171_i0.p1 GENE.NODE_176_length_2421_cov_92.346556_g171_i0~~NODE_176_length_2421_cov_92.346556_g171_i0.p1  ORF type:complete len:791 (+),score=205.78 NODE_176_length_2421_cov_92.346556_g171_i0:240-2375(+)
MELGTLYKIDAPAAADGSPAPALWEFELTAQHYYRKTLQQVYTLFKPLGGGLKLEAGERFNISAAVNPNAADTVSPVKGKGKNKEQAEIPVKVVGTLTFGIGWETVIGRGGGVMNVRIAAACFGAGGKWLGTKRCAWRSQLSTDSGAIVISPCQGNVQGGDDATLTIHFPKVPDNVMEILFLLYIEKPKPAQTMNGVTDAFIRCVNPDTTQELMKYEVDTESKANTFTELGRLVRWPAPPPDQKEVELGNGGSPLVKGDWVFNAVANKGGMHKGLADNMWAKYSAPPFVQLQAGQWVEVMGAYLHNLAVGVSWTLGDKVIDIDLMAFCLDETGVLPTKKDCVYYNNKHTDAHTVTVGPDNRSGKGQGDDETMLITLDKIRPELTEIQLYLSVYKGEAKGHSFADAAESAVRVYAPKGGIELLKFNMADLIEHVPKCYAVHIGTLQREPPPPEAMCPGAARSAGRGQWFFWAHGKGSSESFSALRTDYSTPRPKVLRAGQHITVPPGECMQSLTAGFAWSPTDMQLDVMVFCVNSSGALPTAKDMVYMDNTATDGNTVAVSSDGPGTDAASAVLTLGKVRRDVQSMWLYVTIVDAAARGHSFANLAECGVRLFATKSGAQVCSFPVPNLANSSGTSVLIGCLTRVAPGSAANANNNASTDPTSPPSSPPTTGGGKSTSWYFLPAGQVTEDSAAALEAKYKASEVPTLPPIAP